MKTQNGNRQVQAQGFQLPPIASAQAPAPTVLSGEQMLALAQQTGQNALAHNQQDNQQMQIVVGQLANQLQHINAQFERMHDMDSDSSMEIEIVVKGRGW